MMFKCFDLSDTKTIKYYYSYKNKNSTMFLSKNDLPSYIIHGCYTDYYVWQRYKTFFIRDNDLPSNIDALWEYNYYKYDNCYKYNGYGYIRTDLSDTKKFNKMYKFINGICIPLLKLSISK